MRIFYYLIALAFCFATASGYLLWQTNHAASSPADTAFEISKIKRSFQSKYHPVFTLNLENLKQGRASKELLDPKLALPHYHLFLFSEVSWLSKYTETCNGSAQYKLTNPELKKALIWQRFVCGQMASLPSNFFETTPMIHPSGSSYVALAIRSGRKEFSDPDWIKSNQNKLHLIETLGSDGFASFKLNLSSYELQNFLNSERIVVTSNHVLLSAPGNSSLTDASTSYSIFQRDDWNKFISSYDYLPSFQIDSPACLAREGNICWIYNPDRHGSTVRYLAYALIFGFVSILILLISALVKRSRQQKAEATQRLFTLQMLTHELRTPATSLRLSVEVFRKEFDKLPSESQKAFLRVCEELQRLDRLVDASQKYLRLNTDNHIIENKVFEPSSINQIIGMILEPYLQKVIYKPLMVDRNVTLDRYWIELCVKNLIENALNHGKPPIYVVLKEEGGDLVLSVEDQGSAFTATLHEMSAPFHKGSSSRGLGLGLTIVQKVVAAMNGELVFKPNPTTFSIRLKVQT